jgi:hypothetical protein
VEAETNIKTRETNVKTETSKNTYGINTVQTQKKSG